MKENNIKENGKQLTEKQNIFLETLQTTGDPKLASQEAYGTRDFITRLKGAPNLQRKISQILTDKGLGESDLADKLKRLMNKPDIEDSDFLRALEMAFKLHGSFAPDVQISLELGMEIYKDVSIARIKTEILKLIEEPESNQGSQ